MLIKICHFFEELSVLILIFIVAFGVYSFRKREQLNNIPQHQALVKEATDLALSMMGGAQDTDDDEFHEDNRANGFLHAMNDARSEMGIAPLELDYFLSTEAADEVALIVNDDSMPSARILNDIEELAGEIRGVTVMRGEVSSQFVMEAVRQSDNETAQLLNRNYTKFGFASDEYGLLCVMIFSGRIN